MHESFKELAKNARRRLIEMHFHAGVGHLGGNLSAIDSMLYLHHRVMTRDDLFILSKGHAAGALYITLWSLGILSEKDLDTFHGEGTLLSGHPAPGAFSEIPLATGSLGHGLPVACGIALARKLTSRPGRVFCLCSDGEWQAGSNWEALIFSRHHDLTNLVLLVDLNGLQGFGTTSSVASMSDLADHFEEFDMQIVNIDGHNADSLSALNGIDRNVRTACILHTIKGKGVSFMEGELEWHYRFLSEDLYHIALDEIETCE